MSKQFITKIMKADFKEAIDYVFDNVKNLDIVHDGYKCFLSEKLADYFTKIKEGHIR